MGKWFVALALCAVAGGLAYEVALGRDDALADVSPAGNERFLAVAGKVVGDAHGLYLLDLQNGTVAVYMYVSGKNALRLMAVRNFTFDVQLDEYNTEPSPREIKQLVQQHKRLTETP